MGLGLNHQLAAQLPGRYGPWLELVLTCLPPTSTLLSSQGPLGPLALQGRGGDGWGGGFQPTTLWCVFLNNGGGVVVGSG